jgi:hypothetical protein
VHPEWLKDSIKSWKKKIHTTDTVNLTITQTIHDTQYVNVDAPAEERRDIWPLLTLNADRGQFGDTLFVRTFSLKTGKDGVSKLFVPGYIVGIDAEYPNATPRIDFEPFPPEEKHNWAYPVKYTALGIGIGALLTGGTCLALSVGR